jgi:hypothetical protein
MRPPISSSFLASNNTQAPFVALFPSTTPLLITTLEDCQTVIEFSGQAVSMSLKQWKLSS